MLTKDFEVLDQRFEARVFGNVHVDHLHSGMRWAEGPAYFPAGKYLVWSDIPNDRLMRYDETDVNNRLRAFHPDVAALRRYLVEEGFLDRESGVYWRTGGTVVD